MPMGNFPNSHRMLQQTSKIYLCEEEKGEQRIQGVYVMAFGSCFGFAHRKWDHPTKRNDAAAVNCRKFTCKDNGRCKRDKRRRLTWLSCGYISATLSIQSSSRNAQRAFFCLARRISRLNGSCHGFGQDHTVRDILAPGLQPARWIRYLFILFKIQLHGFRLLWHHS